MTETATSEAAAEYRRRRDHREAAVERDRRFGDRVADARLAVFVLGLGVVVLALTTGRFSWAWGGLPLALFVALVVWSERLKRHLRRSERAVVFYRKGLARLDGTWPGTGVGGERFADENHPYAGDLDLFGRGSLFERLCTARTRSGEETLAAWLLAPADPGTIRARQQAVDELAPRLDLREDLELLGADVREGIDPDALAAWGREPRVLVSAGQAIVARVLAGLAVLSLVLWATTDVGFLPLFVVILVELVFSYRVKGPVQAVIGPIARRTHDLVLLSELLARVEREPFAAPALTRLQATLRSDGEAASVRIARLARRLDALEMRHNQFFAPFAALLLWSFHWARRIDDWRATAGPAIGSWLEAAGEFEALGALAAYRYENPGDVVPEVVEGPALYDGEALGHPLLPAAECIRNDVRLGDDLRVLLVSGSNMSGKSTLLRTVGTNAVLALAGAPVRARSLRLSVVAIGATLRVQDSLQAGRSRFYAELTRVRQLVSLSEGPRPLLFLLDEIFHGTNSHDRVIGAGALVRGLIDRGAIGFVTTHDLALAAVADELEPRARNVHFEDQLVDGVMRFDYRMRPGMVRHSNALALMRAVGLDV